MHYSIKLLLAFSLAALAVDVANPGFYESLINGDSMGWVEYTEPQPVKRKAAKTEETTEPAESEPPSPINFQQKPVQASKPVPEPEPVVAPEPPHNVPGPLWANAYEVMNYSTESYAIAMKLDLKELRNKTELSRKEYHRVLKSGRGLRHTELANYRYKTYKDALKIKNSF